MPPPVPPPVLLPATGCRHSPAPALPRTLAGPWASAPLHWSTLCPPCPRPRPAAAELQKRILARMRAFGMTPVLPAFAGFVPDALAARRPRSKFSRAARWGGFPDQFCCPLMVDPLEPLFQVRAALCALGPLHLLPSGCWGLLVFLTAPRPGCGHAPGLRTVFTHTCVHRVTASLLLPFRRLLCCCGR